MKFTKMHGIGNDYVYVSLFSEQVENPEEAARLISDRHFGVGSDGLILIGPSAVADFRMDMYNGDGSKGAMCGNGIRCVGKYVFDKGLTQKKEITVETLSGIKTLRLFTEDGQVSRARVDMGEPVLDPQKIPVHMPGGMVLETADNIIREYPLPVDGCEYRITCVSMGNPHCVVRVEDPNALDLPRLGPLFENHPVFPDRVNTEFIRVLDEENVQMRVWERGSGETLACGTGACAVAVACILNGWTKRSVTVHLRGGKLDIAWSRADNHIIMTGPAAIVFEGEIFL